MTLLAADIGNGATVIGLLDAGEVIAHWRVGTDVRRTADEWALLLRGLLATADLVPTPSGISVCSAVPSVLHEWRTMVADHFPDIESVFVEPGTRTGLPIRTDNPREVGADRIANALAATTIYGGPAIVVDFGTATTFDVVNGRGHYVGGAIAAGIEISSEALGRHGAQLRRFELAKPRAAIAKNTIEALQSGALYGTAAQVDGLVERMVEELAEPVGVTVVATGSLAALVVDECRCFDHYDEWLTLRGLEMIYRRNID